jgi:hypothetical protein
LQRRGVPERGRGGRALAGPGLAWLFRRNHFGSDPHVIGCALSHLRAWAIFVACGAPPAEEPAGGEGEGEGREQMAPNTSNGSSGEDEWLLVLEDDVEVSEGCAPL